MNKEEKFMLIYEKYRRLLFGIGTRILRDDGGVYNDFDINDALQECWLSISKNLDKLNLDHESATRNYCCTVMKNAAKHIYKTRNENFKANKAGVAIISLDEPLLYYEGSDASEKSVDIADVMASDDLPVDEIIAGFEDVRLIDEILDELTYEEQNMFVMRYYSGYSNMEIEKTLDLDGGSAAWRIQNIKRKLATLIKKRRYEI
ncbi:MAG: sigma-70 family RNA polymerase sigma factor [Clostridiales Family XIII bacterium]|jgi:RNA polymerase sigma factor (sigma-70 family)|nr:sigma-70 family RNA polymerase sigma factor [Clostridiales Family XIII bacterium]